jgi:hypothetical protein
MAGTENGTGNAKRVLVIGQLDASANGLKPREIQRFLLERGHEVRLVDTYRLSRASGSGTSLARRLPALRPSKTALYLTEAASKMLTRRWGFGRRFLSYYLLVADYRLRRTILRSTLPLDDFDLVVCECPYDAGVLADARNAKTLYDAPAPWADEVYYEGRLSARQHVRLRRMETELLEGVNHLSFHWDSYARYAIEQYGISGRNLLTLNFGCVPSAFRARFDEQPRIVYLGNVSSRFQNPDLLARLAKLYSPIDVYGERPPDPQLGLNYLGYAPSLDVLRNYQLGLVTCSSDQLRCDGFSSKHLNYLAYGLPVLVPEWRRHLEALRGSVVYNEHNFRSVLDTLRVETRWESLSNEAYAQAQQLTWDKTLRPLEGLLNR